jgi:lysophospholipase L1-like esterase
MDKRIFYVGTTIVGIGLIYLILKKNIAKNMKSSKPLKSILFVGDSITAITYQGKPVTYTYPNVIKKEVEPKGVKVDVLAIGGKRTSWMLSSLIEKLKNNSYDRVYIYGGVNDMFSATTIKEALNNIQQMVDLTNSKGGEAFVITGYDTKIFMDDDKLVPTNYVPTKEGMIKLKNRYIDFQNSIGSSIKNATIIPKFNISSKYTSDGVHPSGAGQKMIAESLLQDLRKSV